MNPLSRWREIPSFAGLCLVVVACISGFALLVVGWDGWLPFVTGLAANAVLSFAIGGWCWITLPPVGRRTCDWHPFLRWSALLLTMVGAAAGGTGIGVIVARLLGVGESAEQLYLSTFRSALPITLIVGVVATLLEASRTRLARTELELRTQQLQRERAEKLAAEAQFASLSSRVQPHFLFNTLNSIAALIRENPRHAEQMVEQLGSLLRGSLDSADTVPLEREMKLVADYLEIQRTRLGPRLRYEIDWQPQAINGANVPPFAVQTAVENALKHVAGQRPEGVAVRLSARAHAGDLIVEVADDGPGFGLDALKSGHGLDNLQSRLRALYGERAALEFDRAATGMTVRLRVPAA